MSTEVQLGGTPAQPTLGSAGLDTQVKGTAATVSSMSDATGGIGDGHLIKRHVDRKIFQFKSNDTPLMQLMLLAQTIEVKSPEVEHWMYDEPRSSVTTDTAVAANTGKQQFVLPLKASDHGIPRPYDTLLALHVNGYAADGKTVEHGRDLMLFVTGTDTTTGNPIVQAVNGPRTKAADEFCTVPAIPAGTTLVLLSNAMYETQTEVDPDMIVPVRETLYLQKRGFNQVVSDYLKDQETEVDFGLDIQAEVALTNFKNRGNRTLYAGRGGKLRTNTGKAGVQWIYYTTGVRYQVRKELEHFGTWTLRELIATAKMFFTGEDVPKTGLVLCGKNFLENIQCIDYKDHPEIRISNVVNPIGWEVTKLTTVFGNLEFKYDPTLDRLNWSNSAIILSPDRLVHYVRSGMHQNSERIVGEEATRESNIVWDGLALKGSCHIWINGEIESKGNNAPNAQVYQLWSSKDAPAEVSDGCIYFLTVDCPGINANARSGQRWKATKSGDTVNWSECVGEVLLPQA